MTDTLENRRGINANALKYIAIAAMLIDHIGWAFFPGDAIWGQIMHFIGRFTAPIMCYFIAEGYHYTKNLKKYFLRLGIFALISHIPYLMTFTLTDLPFAIRNGALWVNPEMLVAQASIFCTLFLALLAIYLWDNIKIVYLKVLVIIGICALSFFCDWGFFVVLWALAFHIYRDDNRKKFTAYYIIAVAKILYVIVQKLIINDFQPQFLIWQLGILIPPLFLMLYSGKRGKACKFNKWFFYIFYPAHLLIIGLIKLYI